MNCSAGDDKGDDSGWRSKCDKDCAIVNILRLSTGTNFLNKNVVVTI